MEGAHTANVRSDGDGHNDRGQTSTGPNAAHAAIGQPRGDRMTMPVVHDPDQVDGGAAAELTPRRQRRRPRDRFANSAVVFALILVCILFSVLEPNTFPTSGNFTAIVSSQAVLLMLALALTLPMIGGDFDLSISAVMTFSAVVAGVLTTNHGAPVWLAILAALGVGLVVGTINAVLIVPIGLDAFITTLGTMTILLGFSTKLTGGTVLIAQGAEGITSLSNHEVLGLPGSTYYGWILALVLFYLFRYVPFGRHLRIAGRDPNAALRMGLPVTRLRVVAFIGSAVISSFAGVLLLGTLGAADPAIGTQFLLAPFAAVFLGSTTIEMGRFNILGTVVALYLIVVAVTGLQLMGVQDWVSNVFNGCALVLAILFARIVGSRAHA